MKRLVSKIKISVVVDVITGLHVGGSTESVQIGGLDRPVIKAAVRDNQPYIPGSSIKGKMRCLLEQVRGHELGGSEEVNNLFGWQKSNQPSKIIVRDAYLTDCSVNELKKCEALDMPYTEGKWENSIKRVEGIADNPRQTERVPAGAKFSLEMIVNVWDDDDATKLLELLKQGIHLIENDYLGGSGSRGYGQVKFEDWNEEVVYA